MALPFLNPRKVASLIIAKRIPQGVEPVKEEGEEMPAMMTAAEDLLSGISMKDAKRVASALQAAFQMGDSAEAGE